MVYSIVYSMFIFSIPNFQRIKAVKKSLENFPIGVVATKVITTVLSLTLTLTNFVLNYKDYLQIKVCTIGTIFAPAYDNIFMGHFERKCIYSFLKGLSLSYLVFFADIWTASKKQVIMFWNDLNTNHNSMKFEYKISQSSISSLDTEAYINNNKLYTKIWRRVTDRQKFLHIFSEHPTSSKNSLLYSQIFRIKRACSAIKNFTLYCLELTENIQVCPSR